MFTPVIAARYCCWLTMPPPAHLSHATPPITFARVTPGVYRSGFPTTRNLHFLKRLGLKTMIKLDHDAYHDETNQWIADCGIEVVKCDVKANKEPFIIADPEEICKALRVLLDPARHPVLIHSLVGQARVGVVIGCLRRMQRWSLVAIFEEYRRFAGITSAQLDLQCIELFDTALVAANGHGAQGEPPGPTSSFPSTAEQHERPLEQREAEDAQQEVT